MPAEREVCCSECGGKRTTKAATRTLIACTSCGVKFRVPPPAVDVDGVSPPVVDQAPPASTAPAGPPAAPPSSPAVQRATPVIKQRARPRARGADGKFVSDLDDAPPPSAPVPVQSAAAKRSGARGGRGYYGKKVRRAG